MAYAAAHPLCHQTQRGSSGTKPVERRVMAQDFRKCDFGVELVAGIVHAGGRCRFGANPLERQAARIAYSSQGFALFAGIAQKQQRNGHHQFAGRAQFRFVLHCLAPFV